jgi:uncharacterized protein
VIVVDTSGVLAAIDPRQSLHAEAARVLARPQRRILSPLVLAELDYLIATHGGQEQELRFLGDVVRGAYELAPFEPHDVQTAVSIISRYASLQIGLADASVVVLARRHGCRDLLTLDQRHFRVIRGPDEAPFRLLPFDDEGS